MAQQIPDTSFALSTSELKTTMEYVPNLMPFSIDYNGSAPVSTYMRVEIEKRGVGMPLEGEEEKGKEKKKEAARAVAAADDGKMTLCEETEGQGEPGEERYVSTFRGRLMHGLDVRLPGGYSGLVLRNEGGSSKEAKGEEKPKRRRTRSTTSETISDDDVERERETLLVGSGMFSNVRVWQPDMPVDGGRDEYIRSLREWSVLASEIHRAEQ